MYGKVAENDGQERFEWKHSYSRAYQQTGNYSPEGPFMSFEHYNVEVRDRVKCISGIEGRTAQTSTDILNIKRLACLINGVLTLDQRCRQWSNIKSALGQCYVPM